MLLNHTWKASIAPWKSNDFSRSYVSCVFKVLFVVSIFSISSLSKDSASLFPALLFVTIEALNT